MEAGEARRAWGRLGEGSKRVGRLKESWGDIRERLGDGGRSVG